MSIRPKHVAADSAEPLDDLAPLIEKHGLEERFKRNFMKTMLSYQGLGTYKGRVVAVIEEIDHSGQAMSTFYAGYDTIKKYMDETADTPQNDIDLFQRQANITSRAVAETAMEAISARQSRTAMARARRVIRTRMQHKPG